MLVTISYLSLSVPIVLGTFSIMEAVEPFARWIALSMNLFAGYLFLLAVKIMGESLIEDMVKAVIVSILTGAVWHFKFEYQGYIRGLSLSVTMAGWHSVFFRNRFRF